MASTAAGGRDNPASRPAPSPAQNVERKAVARSSSSVPGKQGIPAREPARKAAEQAVTPDVREPAQRSGDRSGNTAPFVSIATDGTLPARNEKVEEGDIEEAGVLEADAGELLPLPVVTLETLPMTFGQWELDLRSWSSGKVECVVTSPGISFFDGYEPSSLLVKILDHGLVVETESAIDLSYEVTGLRLQPGVTTPFSGVVKTNNVELNRDSRRELAQAEEFTLLLGFWPTWPRKGVQEISVPLQGLRPAIAALDLCQQL